MTDHQTGVLAEPAPTFALSGIDGQTYRLSDYAGSVVVLDFWSAHCPWSQHYDGWLAEQAPRWAEQGIHVLAVAPPYGCALVRFASLETVTPGEEAR